MNDELMRKQILKDYEEILNTDAGRRILGGIFYAARLNNPGPLNDYMQGRRDMALTIANTIREISPHSLANCEISYQNFKKELSNGSDRTGNDDDNRITRDYDE